MILYGNKQSGHSYKVALALALLGLPHEYRAVDLMVPRPERPAGFRAVSRFGEVPVLVVEGRPPLVQSNAILLHLARTTGRLGGDDPDGIAQWLFWESNRVGLSVPNLRLARKFMPDTPPEVVAWLEGRAVGDLDRLDLELADKPFLMGDTVTVADLSCCGYLFWLDQAGLDAARWPAMAAWLDRVRTVPGWKHPYELLA